MARRTPVEHEHDEEFKLPPPARTLEGRNDQLIEAAFNLAERRIHQGTASAQEVVHFLKQGSMKDKLEMEKLKNETLVLQTRVKEMESRRSSEEMAEKALAAMRGYQGIDELEHDPNELDNLQF